MNGSRAWLRFAPAYSFRQHTGGTRFPTLARVSAFRTQSPEAFCLCHAFGYPHTRQIPPKVRTAGGFLYGAAPGSRATPSTAKPIE